MQGRGRERRPRGRRGPIVPGVRRHLAGASRASSRRASGRRTASGRRRAALILLAGTWIALAGPAAAGAALPAVTSPNDPLFRYQWHLPAIQIPAAWAISRGAGATVAVLDTGVAYERRGPYRRAPDLAGTRFVAGWDFVDDDPHPDDVAPRDGHRSHGTLMATLIAATAGDAIGGVGVAPDAAIMPVRVLHPDLRGSARTIARGVRFAVDHGADVVNLSIAGPSPTRTLTAALRYAAARGVTVVAAAGNDGLAQVSWPAADPSVLAVGALRRDLTRADYSNHGRALDLVAPSGAGERDDNGYGPSDGVPAQTLKGGPAEFCFCFTASTSAAAAQVSGVAALLVGARPGLGRAELRRALLASARDLGSRGRDAEYGAGLVQARDALARIHPDVASTTAEGAGRASSPDPWPAISLIASAVLLLGLGLALMRRRQQTR